jgi:hypothetical protein
MSAAVHDVHGSTLPSTDADVIGDFGDAITQFGYGYEAHILCMTHPRYRVHAGSLIAICSMTTYATSWVSSPHLAAVLTDRYAGH